MGNEEKDNIQEEAFDALKASGFNGAIQIVTGAGKAKILIECLKALKPKGKIWYLCDSIKNRDVTFREELIKWKAEKYIDKIEFMCYQTAYKIKGEEIELALFDEADYFLTPEYSKVIKNNTFTHKILATATFAQDKLKQLGKIVPIVYKKTLAEADGTGLVNDSNYYMVKYLLNPEENNMYLKYNMIFSRLMSAKPVNRFRLEQTQLQRKLFLSMLNSSAITCKLLLGELYKDERKKIIIFCGTSKQADRVCKYSYHSNADNEQNFRDFDKGKIRVLSVVGKIDRGVNINGINNVIFEAPTSSATKFQQRQGRSKRLDIEDKSDVYFLVPHFKDKYGSIKPTIVNSWVIDSMGDLKTSITTYNLKEGLWA